MQTYEQIAWWGNNWIEKKKTQYSKSKQEQVQAAWNCVQWSFSKQSAGTWQRIRDDIDCSDNVPKVKVGLCQTTELLRQENSTTLYPIRCPLTLIFPHKVAFHTSVRLEDGGNILCKSFDSSPLNPNTTPVLFMVVGCWCLSTAITWPGQEPHCRAQTSLSSRFTLGYTDGEAGFRQSVKEPTGVLKVGEPGVTVKVHVMQIIWTALQPRHNPVHQAWLERFLTWTASWCTSTGQQISPGISLTHAAANIKVYLWFPLYIIPHWDVIPEHFYKPLCIILFL